MTEFIFQNGLKCPQIEGEIMLIDDDDDDQLIFQSVVEKINPSIRCFTAWNGIEGLEKLKSEKIAPELIFVDLNMPMMNGPQFLEEVRQLQAFRNTPMIMLSTSADKRNITTILEKGAWHFITKPNHFSEWEQELFPLLSVKPGSNASPPEDR